MLLLVLDYLQQHVILDIILLLVYVLNVELKLQHVMLLKLKHVIVDGMLLIKYVFNVQETQLLVMLLNH